MAMRMGHRPIPKVNKVVKNNNKVLTEYFPLGIIKMNKGNTNKIKEKGKLV